MPTPANAATSLFEFTGGNLNATHRGKSGFSSSPIRQQYASSVAYNQNGQTSGSFDQASVTPASGSSAEARDAVGWLLASTFEGGGGSFPPGGNATSASTGYTFTITPNSGHTLDFSNAKFVLDLGASKRSSASAAGSFRAGLFYKINSGPLISYRDNRDFEVTVSNDSPNVSHLDSLASGDSLLDPNNPGSIARTIENDYQMTTGLSVDLGDSITGLSQGDSVTFYLLGVTDRNGTAYNLLVDNLGIAGLTTSNPSTSPDIQIWNPLFSNDWDFYSTFVITRENLDGTTTTETLFDTNWDVTPSPSPQFPTPDTSIRFEDLGSDQTIKLQGDRTVAEITIDSPYQNLLDQPGNHSTNTLYLDGDFIIRNTSSPSTTNYHRSYCNIHLLSNSTWDIAPEQSLELIGELQGCADLTKTGNGVLWIYSQSPSPFLGNMKLEEGQLVAAPDQLTHALISFTEAPDDNATRTLFLEGVNPRIDGLGGPADGEVILTEPAQTLTISEQGIVDDNASSTISVTAVVGPAANLDLNTSTYHCNIRSGQSDLLKIDGNLDISGATLEADFDTIPSHGSFLIADCGSITGNFAQISPSWLNVDISGGQIWISQPALYVDSPDDLTPPNPAIGDTVSWNGRDVPVTGLVFGTNVFSSIQDAVDHASDNTIINLAPGIYNEGQSLIVDKSLFLIGSSANTSTLTGQGLHRLIEFATPSSAGAGQLTIHNLTLTEGTEVGAAILVENQWDNIELINCAVTSSLRTAIDTFGKVTSKNCLFAFNRNNNQSAVFVLRGTHPGEIVASSENCTFSQNYSRDERTVIYFPAHNLGEAEFIGCSFFGNRTDERNYSRRTDGTNKVYFSNCLSAGNPISRRQEDLLVATRYIFPVDLGGNYLNRVRSGSNYVSRNPVEVVIDPVLWDNGGPTLTHAIPLGSPALGAGINSLIPADSSDLDQNSDFSEATPVDQRGPGFLRIQDGTVDAGAIEGGFLPRIVYVDAPADYLPASPAHGDLVTWTSMTGESLALTFGFNAFATISDAVAGVRPGGIIVIAAGTYDEGAEITISKSLSLQGEGPDQTILNGGGNGDLVMDANEHRVLIIDDGISDTLLNVSLQSLTIQNGTSLTQAGGIYAKEANLTFKQCQIQHSRALVSTSATSAAALILDTGSLEMHSCTIADNIADGTNSNGGAFFLRFANSSFTQCTFEGNLCGPNGSGGAIQSFYSDLSFSHCTLTANFGGTGSAIDTNGSAHPGYAAATHFTSTIIAGNSGSAVEINCNGADTPLTSSGHNLVGTSNKIASFNQTGDQTAIVDPILAPIGNYGGPLRTCPPLDGSPAINGADASLLPADTADLDNDNDFLEALPYDQRGAGYPRIQGDTLDIGAAEYLDKFELWIRTEFPGETDPAIIGALADPGETGILNIVAFITDTDPLDPNPNSYTTTLSETEMKIRYTLRRDTATMNPHLQFSEDLNSFFSLGDFLTKQGSPSGGTTGVWPAIRQTSDGIDVDLFEVTLQISEFPQVFTRLSVDYSTAN